MSHPPCPPQSVLYDWAQGNLHESQAHSVEDHLEHCSDCELIAASINILTPEEMGVINPGYTGEGECSEVLNQVLSRLQIPISGAVSKRKEGTYVGLRLRDYELISLVGRGGMGAVYRAEHTVLRKQVAIKILPDQDGLDSSVIARFRREMQAVGTLDHPNIVRALDAGEVEGIRFLVMELIEGEDLSSLARGGRRFSVEESCEIVRQIAAGLSYVHEQNLIHRDIKPSNIMLSQESSGAIRVRVLDLGLALLPDSGNSNTPLTAESQLVGTLEYMSPEQTESSDRLDHRVDIYSLGVTLFRLLSGTIPFRRQQYKSPVHRLKALTTKDPDSIATRVSGLPETLIELVDAMISRVPDRRPQSMPEVLDLIQKHIPREGLSAFPIGRVAEPSDGLQRANILESDTSPTACETIVSPEHVRSAKSSRLRDRQKLLGALAAMVAVVCFAVWWIRTDGGYLRIQSDIEGSVTLHVMDEAGRDTEDLTVSQNGGRYWISSGRYRLSIEGNGENSLALDSTEVVVHRGSRTVIRVSRVREESRGAELAAEAASTERMNTPRWKWGSPENMGRLVNTEWKDGQATVSSDGLTLIFSSYCIPRFDGEGDRDLWVMRRQAIDLPWSEPRNPGPSVNSPMKEMKPAYHAESRTLFFSSNRDRGVGGEDLWQTTHSPDFLTWSSPVNVGPNANSQFDDSSPNVSSDGLTLLFTSTRPAASGGCNLWFCTRESIGERWGPPQELTEANSEFDDCDPSISTDGRVLMFASVRPGGFGRKDIWALTRESHSHSWSTAFNLGAAVNSRASECHPCQLPGQRGIVFSSDRDSGFGDTDLWVVKRFPDGDRARSTVRLSGNRPLAAVAPFDSDTAAQLQHDWAAYLGVPVTYTNSLGMPFHLLPPGEFRLGPGDAEHQEAVSRIEQPRPSPMNPDLEKWLIQSEWPARKVRLTRPFYMGTIEVREKDYDNVVGISNPIRQYGPDFPIGMVSWLRAARFCNELNRMESMPPRYVIEGRNVTLLEQTHGYRLPTEAQWEYACRAGSETLFPFGDDETRLNDYAWCQVSVPEKGHQSAFRVGQKLPNAFGLHDMLGNHWEWCEDAAVEKRTMMKEPWQNPMFNADVAHRLARGGFVFSIPTDLRAARRRRHMAHMIYPHGGFRIILKLQLPSE